MLADTRQPEIDYQAGSSSGNPVDSTYNGKDATGGVQLKNFLVKAAFAIRFGDFNLLVSDLVTSHSRLMFVRDITQMAQKAAPFLSYDSDPYPVLSEGRSTGYSTPTPPPTIIPTPRTSTRRRCLRNSGLNQNINYVRNSVKVVVNAYSGKMTFFDVTGLTHSKDPILQTWEKVFPGMFTPVSQMPAALQCTSSIPRGPAQRADGCLRPLPHHPAARLLQHRQRRGTSRRVRVPDHRTRPCRRPSRPTHRETCPPPDGTA